MGGDVLAWIQSGASLGLLALCSKLYVDNRRLKIAENKDEREGWGQLIQLLEDRVSRLEKSEQECQRRLNEALRRIAELEGYDSGQGMARQDVAVLKSAERIVAEKNKKPCE